MNKHTEYTLPNGARPTLLSLALAAAIVAGCSSDGSGVQPNEGGSYLFVSVPNFYFGTRDVGSSATQEIEIANRGGDIYPINSLGIVGADADEFTTDLLDDIVLHPSEAVKVRVTFSPITNGRKEAALDIDYDTIKQVSEEANQHEQNYYRARDLEAKQQYDESLVAYDDYIDGNPVTVNKQRAAIKAPMIKESTLYGQDEDFTMYLTAVNARDAGSLDQAMAEIDALLLLHGDSFYADDALYLRGYIQLMDQKDYSAAEETMRDLRQRFPDTTYYDTALYSEGLAHQSLGNTGAARSIFEDLRARHTGVDALGVALPKDNMMSRAWFQRASDALDSLG